MFGQHQVFAEDNCVDCERKGKIWPHLNPKICNFINKVHPNYTTFCIKSQSTLRGR